MLGVHAWRACGATCDSGELCSAGKCAATCLGGSTRCGSRCVDVDTDPAHCGACNAACTSGEACVNGACGLLCLGGSTQCGSSCVDLRYDPAHCGSCDKACATGAACNDGSCTVGCGSGHAQCSGTCTDLSFDPNNCGSCGKVCVTGKLCSAGECGAACVDSIQCAGVCIEPLTDSANCGGCGKACGVGQTCVNGTCGLHCDISKLTQCNSACVDVSTDSKNCGSCFKTCTTGHTCTSGACTCTDGKTDCANGCTDTALDAANCGACGAACGTNEACSASKCECRPGTQRCGNACVDTSVAAANCGACGSQCAAGKVCTAGACAAATSDWPTFQWGITHTGENPDETGKPPLALSWQRKLNANLQPVAVGSGRIFATSATYFAPQSPLVVLDLSDGTDLWSYNFGAVDSLGLPSVFGGAAYLANGQGVSNPSSAYLWSFDAAKGTANWGAALSAQWEHYWAPIVAGNVVYTNAGTYGGLYGISTADGSQAFFVGLDQYDSWSPAYFSGNIYTWIAGKFRKHTPATGVITSTLAVDWNWSGYTMATAPVFDNTRAYVISPPNLLAIDPVLAKVSWTANGTYAGTPAVSGGLVYGISAGNLVVRDAATGSLAWTFVGDTALNHPPVIANGYVYVASDSNVYGVAIASHAQAFTAAVGGWLSISSGRLLVAGKDGMLSAYLMSN